MKHKLGSVLTLIALASAGCGSKDVVGDFNNLTNYGNVQPKKIQHEGKTWGVLDKPEEERMLIVSMGAHGSLGNRLGELAEGAAREHLNHTNRVCEIESKRLASSSDLSIEIIYNCN